VQPRLSHRLATQPSGCAIGFRASSTAPARIRQIRAGGRIEGPPTPIHFRCTFPSRLRGRGVWQCRRAATLSGLLPVSRASPRSTCPQLLATAASVAGGVFSSRYISASWRTNRFAYYLVLSSSEFAINEVSSLCRIEKRPLNGFTREKVCIDYSGAHHVAILCSRVGGDMNFNLRLPVTQHQARETALLQGPPFSVLLVCPTSFTGLISLTATGGLARHISGMTSENTTLDDFKSLHGIRISSSASRENGCCGRVRRRSPSKVRLWSANRSASGETLRLGSTAMPITKGKWRLRGTRSLKFIGSHAS
jgi:hypothetical protein